MDSTQNSTQNSKEQLHNTANHDHNHSLPRILLIAFTAFFLILTLALNGLSASAGGGLFLSNQKNLSDKFYLSVTPAGWTFSIWGVIYTFQVLFVILAVVAIFRKGSDGYLYLNPSVFPVTLFVAHNLANVCNIIWLFTFDREVISVAFAFLLCGSISCYFTVGISIYALHRHRKQIEKEFYWMGVGIQVFVQNGVGMYAAWTTIATLLNLAMVLHYDAGVEESSACTIILSVLLVEIFFFSVVDIVFLDRFTRPLITPYITFIVALIGSFTNHKDPDPEKETKENDEGRNPRTPLNRNFTIGLLTVACLICIVKIVTKVWREKTKPISNGGPRSS